MKRSTKEITEELDELFDKIWWNRHKCLESKIEEGLETCDPEIWRTALAAAKRIEQKYPELGWDDFDLGMLHGKMSALRWVLGDDWDNLDT